MVEASPNFGGISESISTEVTGESAEKISEPIGKKQEIDSEMKNEEECQERLEHRKKCKAFTDWCHRVGIEFPGLEYPGYFEGGLVGVKTTKDIAHREAFLKIPYKCLMSVQKARDHEVLGNVFRENPTLFSEKCSHDWEQLILFTFVIYEFQKGEESFWWPYLDLMPDFEFFCDWPEKEVFNV